MKKAILLLSVISILFLAGCNKNENVENSNLSGDIDNKQQLEINNEEIMNELISNAESGAEKEGVCSFFVADSVHEDTPGGYGSGMPASYYFLSNNTYFWDAGDYFDPMSRVRAKAGTWKIERIEDDSVDLAFVGKLVLNEKYELYLEGDEIAEVDVPGGGTENGLINYNYTLKEVDNLINEKIEFIGVSEYSLNIGNVESPAYEYKLGEEVMYSNVVKIDMPIEKFVKKDFHTSLDNWVNTLIELMLNNNQNIEDELYEGNNNFEERTAHFFTKQKEIKGDRLRQEFNNVRLTKVDNHYELKADLLGDVKIEAQVLEEAIKEINEKNLEQIEINTLNGEEVIIYSSKPQEIIDWHESVKKDYEYEFDFNEVGVPTYFDEDWIKAKSDDEWLNEDGIPMYVLYNGKYVGGWAILIKEEDDYYLYGRSQAGVVDIANMLTINEEDAITIELLADDKIILDINDFYGNLSDNFEPMVLTVEEYYNLSPKDGTSYITEDRLHINISNMSEDNYYSIGLNVSEGAIHVIARCDAP